MNYQIIATGSKGNAVLINNSILIDCGVPYSKLKPYEKQIKIIFLTHCHQDHFNTKTILKLYKEHPLIRFACCFWLYLKLVELGIPKKNIDYLETFKTYNYKKFKVKAEPTNHDVDNCCYHFEIDEKTLLYATDLNNLMQIKAKNYDFYLIEGNYIEEELKQRKQEKIDNEEFVIEDRILRTHTSREECILFFEQNAKDDSILEILHQHKDKEVE